MASCDDGCRRSPPPPNSNPKKQKVTVTCADETLDRISQLPDSLLVQILSLMPTRYAFTTCILSKRWRYLWTSVYNFDFNYLSSVNVVPFVDYVFAHSVSPKIKKIEFDFTYLIGHNEEISRWVSFAVERKVEDVVFWAGHDVAEDYLLPQSFFTCSSLITLTISCCYIGFDLELPSLKSIKLDSLKLTNEDVMNLLSGCPILETMELCCFKGVSRLEINSLNLKRLKLQRYCLFNDELDGRDHSLEIIAPYVQHLEISGDLINLECSLVDVSSVVKAELTFNIDCIKDIQAVQAYNDYDFDEEEESCCDYHQVFRTLVQDYLQKLKCATDITIGPWFTEVVCMLLFKGVSIPELKCKYLTLEFCMEKFNLYGAAGLLRAAPYVETLNIYMCTRHFGGYYCQFESRYLAEGENIDLQSWISCCVFPNLKNVKLVTSFWMCLKDHSEQGYDKLFKLSDFLLRNAIALEKFIIISKTRKCPICSMNCVSTFLYQLAGKLLRCPRSSTKSVIIFQE